MPDHAPTQKLLDALNQATGHKPTPTASGWQCHLFFVHIPRRYTAALLQAESHEYLHISYEIEVQSVLDTVRKSSYPAY